MCVRNQHMGVTVITQFDSLQKIFKVHIVRAQFMDEVTESQRSQVSCSNSYNAQMVEPRFKARFPQTLEQFSLLLI